MSGVHLFIIGGYDTLSCIKDDSRISIVNCYKVVAVGVYISQIARFK